MLQLGKTKINQLSNNAVDDFNTKFKVKGTKKSEEDQREREGEASYMLEKFKKSAKVHDSII